MTASRPSPSNLTSLTSRLRNHARDAGQIETRVRRRLSAVVVHEIFSRVPDLVIEGPVLLVKGGTALDIRRGAAPARLSKDFDAAVRGDLDAFLARARAALEAGWSGFTGRMTDAEDINVPGVAVAPRRFNVKLDYRGKPFGTVPVELSSAEARSGGEFDAVSVTEYSDLGLEPAGPVYLLSLRYQVAQKIHACTDPLDGHQVNTRARDLVDLQLLAQLLDLDDLSSVHEACREIFDWRARHAWPPEVVVPEVWPVVYAAACEGIDDVVQSVEAAAAWLTDLIAKIAEAR